MIKLIKKEPFSLYALRKRKQTSYIFFDVLSVTISFAMLDPQEGDENLF